MSFHDILYSPAYSWRLNDASVVSGSILEGNAPPSANPLHAPGFFTMMGVTPEEAVKEIRKKGADVVGANCGNGIENMVKIARIMRKVDDGPLIIHSNAGFPKIVNGRIIYPETAEFMAGKFNEMKDIGINIFGGCCGTTPDHISAIKSVISND